MEGASFSIGLNQSLTQLNARSRLWLCQFGNARFFQRGTNLVHSITLGGALGFLAALPWHFHGGFTAARHCCST
jgi:hypothetical protein